MQSLGFLGSGTAFGVSVHKKDGLHLSQAWLVMVILVALYITKAYMHFFLFFFNLEEPLCVEDCTNLGDTSQADEIMKIL